MLLFKHNPFAYKNTCIAETTYALFLYLIYTPLKDIYQTHFFIGGGVPADTIRALPNSISIRDAFDTNDLSAFKKYCIKKFRWQIIFTKVFAQDHMDYCPGLIGYSPYTFIEDGSGFFSYYKYNNIFSQKPKSIFHKSSIRNILRFGPVYGRNSGRSILCTNRLVTNIDDLQSDLLKGRKYTIVDLKLLWENADFKKREYIKKIFGIPDKTLSFDVIVLTQYYSQIGILTEGEQVELYKKHLTAYSEERICIKPHPSEVLDYTKYWPKSTILPSRVPMQLLTLCGLKVKDALTINSTAVSLLPKGTKIIWLGYKSHEKFAKFEEFECPY